MQRNKNQQRTEGLVCEGEGELEFKSGEWENWMAINVKYWVKVKKDEVKQKTH
jgi:hypothetical protein